MVYAGTGASQPLIVEELSRRGLAPQIVLWPMLANCIGMLAVYPLALSLGLVAKRKTRNLCRRFVLEACLVDFGSAALLNLALLRAGAASFTLSYSSCTLFVALMGSKRLKRSQWMGIMMVTSALILYATTKDRGSKGNDNFGSLFLALSGSLGHSYMFVLGERAIDAGHISPFELSSAMGFVEASLLALWSFLVATFAPEAFGQAQFGDDAFKGYSVLATVDALHALSFFATLGRRGAVSASLLKGVQIVLVYAASKLVFGCRDHTLNCFCNQLMTMQSAAVAAVVVALTIFYKGLRCVDAEDGRFARSSPPSPRRTTMPIAKSTLEPLISV